MCRGKLLSVAAAVVVCGVLPAAAEDIVTIDRTVGHRSTVPVIEGQYADLFVREVGPASVINSESGEAEEGKVVLFIHGGVTPPTVAFDFPYQDYSWMRYLAAAGYDVFTMEMTGYGQSTRPAPISDPCNMSSGNQQNLVGTTLKASCNPSYPHQLVNSDSETADIDAVVNFIRDLRGVDKITLIGWSGGGIRTGTYTYRHQENVDRLIIWASSNYNRDNPSDPSDSLPAPGVPMTLQTRERGELERWIGNQTCENQIAVGVPDMVWLLQKQSDELGASWGPGVLRAPTRTYWGWNDDNAGTIRVPTLIMVGQNDGLLESNSLLFDDLGSEQKAFIEIACGTHFMVWEHAGMVLREQSLNWLEHTSINGTRSGRFRAGENGVLTPQ